MKNIIRFPVKSPATTPVQDITVRQLRAILTTVAGQEMTVRELRQALFAMEEQDAPVAPALPFIG